MLALWIQVARANLLAYCCEENLTHSKLKKTSNYSKSICILLAVVQSNLYVKLSLIDYSKSICNLLAVVQSDLCVKTAGERCLY